MKRSLTVFLLAVGLVVLALPFTFVVTFLLYPFWSWIEARFGIESIGHSGPADWCFLAIFALSLAIAAICLILFVRKTDSREPPVH